MTPQLLEWHQPSLTLCLTQTPPGMGSDTHVLSEQVRGTLKTLHMTASHQKLCDGQCEISTCHTLYQGKTKNLMFQILWRHTNVGI